jgi:hypothetical protein
MSNDEKLQQIGTAVVSYNEAKVECAQIDQKIRKVFATYRILADSMDKTKGTVTEPIVKDGKLDLSYRSERFESAYLLDENGLVGLLTERDEARQRLAEAKKAKDDLGLTNVD